MAGLIVLGCMIPRAVSVYRSYERTIDVKGLCEMEVKADRVIWPITFKVMSDDLRSIYSQIDENTGIIKAFLEEGGIGDGEITVSVPAVSDKYASEYGENQRPYRYVAKNVITVCTDNVDAVLELTKHQSELLKKGIVVGGNEWENKIEFSYESLNGIKPAMIEEATKNARYAAEKFAKDSGSRIGKIKNATQGTFSISDRDSNTPYLKKVRIVTYVTYYLKK